MTPSPQVSVVIPTYNRAEMLRAALQSVLSQTTPAQQIVVVDDGSTDHTPDVIRQLTDAGAPITYLQGPHLNRRGEARNRGVAATTTPLIAFLDSDDLWKPARIGRQLESLSRSPEAGFAFCNVHRFDESGLIGGPSLRPGADYNGSVLDDLLQEPLAASSTLLVRRDAFDAVGGFADLRLNEDYELTLRLASRYKAGYVPEVLVLMREHPGRTSRAQEMSLLDYIQIVRHFLATHPGLPRRTLSRADHGLANVHFKLARLYLQHGNKPAARHHLRALLKLRPWDRRAPLTYLRSLELL